MKNGGEKKPSYSAMEELYKMMTNENTKKLSLMDQLRLSYFAEGEGESKKESINNYQFLFFDCEKNPPNLKASLKQLFESTKTSREEKNELVEDITNKCEIAYNKNEDKIKMMYPYISKEDALVIISYTCESINEEFSPYKLINNALVSKERKSGIEKVTKYFYLLLSSLRKLKKYQIQSNYLYRCINKNVNINIFKADFIPYILGNTKTFWGFTSTSTNIDIAKKFLGDNEGTIFHLYGNICGYDITPFNYYNENEILIEPEREIYISEQPLEINGILNIKCFIKKTPLVLNSIICSMEHDDNFINNNYINKYEGQENKINNQIPMNPMMYNNNPNYMGNMLLLMGMFGNNNSSIEDEEWMKGFKLGIEEVSNNLSDDSGPKITVEFSSTSGFRSKMEVIYGLTVDNLLEKFFRKIGRLDLIGDNSCGLCFFFKTKPLNFGDQTLIENFVKYTSNPIVTINEIYNIIGA